MNRLASATSPVPAAAPGQPGRLVGVGRRGVRRGARGATCPVLLSRRVRRLPLVPRHGARVVRGPGDRGPDERRLRLRQGRPRGAARRRRRLHGGDPGADRSRRLADDRVPHPAGPAVLRRHVLPAGAAARACRRSARCSAAIGEAWRERRDEVERRRGADRRASWPRGAGRRRRRRPPTPTSSPRAVRLAGREYDAERGGFGGAPKFPPSMVLEWLLRHARAATGTAPTTGRAAGAARWPSRTLRAMARSGMYDQLEGGFARYSRRRRLGRAALREDALRQRPARPASTCTGGG